MTELKQNIDAIKSLNENYIPHVQMYQNKNFNSNINIRMQTS